ncbi:MAG: RNA-binding S4 domain-containing protein [Limnochordaceae bacterium]|uniref:RNA-binding S4 domain-containing protein n=1 Tax=Carboxydichorda subterranea TaxID=3109565 RepID=A0ABZ1BWS0_9FIRM|nr:RNA-binding S4 domain-containing protein [Limnochorda sp. L945t]MBE3599647.1 RNA-binding S4 domain-containing protein [Limnochordaceae bacterium]WRP17123.1 RNA-binding S4 domain-containing protein [Limnochorda sp. L945t]
MPVVAAVPVGIREEPIELQQFLKLSGAARTGGEAKVLIGAGRVRVNGRPELRRSRKLRPGDEVEVAGRGLFVVITRLG